MRGLLADVNVQGHLPYLRRLPLFGIAQEQQYRDRPRIWVPLSWT